MSLLRRTGTISQTATPVMRAKTALMAPLAFGGRLLKTPLSPRAVPSLRCFSQGHSMRRKARDNGSESMAARPPVVFPYSGRCRGVGKESNTALRTTANHRVAPTCARRPWFGCAVGHLESLAASESTPALDRSQLGQFRHPDPHTEDCTQCRDCAGARTQQRTHL